MKNSSAYAMPGNSPFVSDATTSCARITIRPIETEKATAALESTVKFSSALVVSALVGWLSAWLSAAAIDSGFDCIEKMTGQPLPHGVFLAMGIWFFLVPFAASFSFGCLRTLLKAQGRLWTLAPLAAVVVLGSADLMLDGAWLDLLELTPWLAFAAISAMAGMHCGMRAAKHS